MADTEEVSSTTPSGQPKVETSPWDVTPEVHEAVPKVPENGELPKEVPQEAPAAVTDVPAPEVPPETAPPAPEPVTSTTEDATEQPIEEAVTVEAAPTAPVIEEKPVVVPEPEPVVVPEPVPEPVVVPEPEPVVVPEPVPEPVVVPEPVPEPVVEAPVPEPAPLPPVVVEEPPVVAAPPPAPEPAPVVVSEPVIVQEEPPKVEAPVEEPVVVEPPKVEEPAPAPEPKVEKPEPAYEPAPAAPAPSLSLMQYTAVVDLLYWRDVKTSGVVFGAFMLLLLSLTVCSIITVLSYVALALLSATVTFRIYKGVMQAIQKSDEGHPFKAYLEKEMALSEDLVNKYSDTALGKLNGVIVELRRLFLVEDLVDSLKFAVFMWILTYVGALFNGLTLLILGLIAAFSCPIVYEKHQTQIDQQLAMINNQIKDVVGKVQAKVPGLKKKAE